MYLNTDLDLISSRDLTDLAAALDAGGVFPLHVTRDGDGFWHARFETADQYPDPAASIAALVAAAESLSETHRAIWSGCSMRELNIGYDCEAEAAVLNNSLSPELLRRVAAVGASLAITVYPIEITAPSVSISGPPAGS